MRWKKGGEQESAREALRQDVHAPEGRFRRNGRVANADMRRVWSEARPWGEKETFGGAILEKTHELSLIHI